MIVEYTKVHCPPCSRRWRIVDLVDKIMLNHYTVYVKYPILVPDALGVEGPDEACSGRLAHLVISAYDFFFDQAESGAKASCVLPERSSGR